MVQSAINTNARRRSVIEPLFGRIGFDVAAGPSLDAAVVRQMFVDSANQTTNGPVNTEYDQNLSGQQTPAGQRMFLHGLACRAYLSDFSAVLSDAQQQMLGENIALSLVVGDQRHKLGKLAEWVGPFGSPTGLNNVTHIRRFGWPWMERSVPFEVPPGVSFYLEFRTLRAMTTILTASKTVCISAVLPREITQAGALVQKQ